MNICVSIYSYFDSLRLFKTIIVEVKTLILHLFIEPKATGRYLTPV